VSEIPKPKLSVIVIIGELRDRAQKSIRALEDQTTTDPIEIIIIDLAPPEEAPLQICRPDRVIYHRESTDLTLASAKRLGVHLAKSDLVAFVEDHCYVSPNWAEAVIDAYQTGNWSIIGFAFHNANTQYWLSRQAFFFDFAMAKAPTASGIQSGVPCNNIAFKKQFLLDFEQRYGDLPFPEVIYQEYCAHEDIPVYLEGRAEASHDNFIDLPNMVKIHFIVCHLIASNRTKLWQWSLPRRLFYSIAVIPGAPILKLIRLMAFVHRRRLGWGNFFTALPVILTDYIIAAWGESLGYIYRLPSASTWCTRWELSTPRLKDKK